MVTASRHGINRTCQTCSTRMPARPRGPVGGCAATCRATRCAYENEIPKLAHRDRRRNAGLRPRFRNTETGPPIPRFRALALFGRRPPQRVDRPSSRRPKTCAQAVIHAPQQRYRRFWRPSTPSIVGEAPSRATKPTTVVGYIIIIPVQASDPFAVALLERFGECGFRCFVACAVTRNDPDRAYTLN